MRYQVKGIYHVVNITDIMKYSDSNLWESYVLLRSDAKAKTRKMVPKIGKDIVAVETTIGTSDGTFGVSNVVLIPYPPTNCDVG